MLHWHNVQWSGMWYICKDEWMGMGWWDITRWWDEKKESKIHYTTQEKRKKQSRDDHSPSLMLPMSLISSSWSSLPSSSLAADAEGSCVAYRDTYSFPIISNHVIIWRLSRTSDFSLVIRGMPHQQSSSLPIQRIIRVWIPQQLRQKHVEYVQHVKHRRPGLIDNI